MAAPYQHEGKAYGKCSENAIKRVSSGNKSLGGRKRSCVVILQFANNQSGAGRAYLASWRLVLEEPSVAVREDLLVRHVLDVLDAGAEELVLEQAGVG